MTSTLPRVECPECSELYTKRSLDGHLLVAHDYEYHGDELKPPEYEPPGSQR